MCRNLLQPDFIVFNLKLWYSLKLLLCFTEWEQFFTCCWHKRWKGKWWWWRHATQSPGCRELHHWQDYWCKGLGSIFAWCIILDCSHDFVTVMHLFCEIFLLKSRWMVYSLNAFFFKSRNVLSAFKRDWKQKRSEAADCCAFPPSDSAVY